MRNPKNIKSELCVYVNKDSYSSLACANDNSEINRHNEIRPILKYLSDTGNNPVLFQSVTFKASKLIRSFLTCQHRKKLRINVHNVDYLNQYL